MAIFQELGAVAVLVPVLLAVFLAVGVIFFITLLLEKVPALRSLRKPVLMLGSLLATAVVAAGLAWYLTKLAIEQKGTVEGLRIAEKTIDEKTTQIAEQKKIIADLQTSLDAAKRELAAAQADKAAASGPGATEMAKLRQRAADAEKLNARYRADMLLARTRLDNTLRYVGRDSIAAVVAGTGKLTDEEFQKLGAFSMTVIQPTVRSARMEVLCPMKYVTPGTTFTLLAGKEGLAPSAIDFDAAKWELKLTFYAVDTIENAMRFTKTDECTLVGDNKVSPCHLLAVFKKGATENGWLTSTTAFSLSHLEIGATRITKTADGWLAQPLPPVPSRSPAAPKGWYDSLKSRILGD